ncbi:methyltransferase domain-containing protein [Aggregatilineales bacterium SYSU G02658]
MTDWLVVVGIVGLLGSLILWWLLIHTEGVLLGQRVVTALYDLYASRYDRIKGNDDVDEHIFIAQPLLEAIAPQTDPFVIDVACGTGRVALALCQHARFEGIILSVDASLRMLQVAAHKLAANHFEDYALLAQMDAAQLHIADASADVVTCMEALEFTADPTQVLAELARVLRPGGLLLTTLRQNAPLVPRVWSQRQMQQALAAAGFVDVRFQPWQHDYQQVWARRAGSSHPIGAYLPEAALRCPRCGGVGVVPSADGYACPHCGWRVPRVGGVLQMV